MGRKSGPRRIVKPMTEYRPTPSKSTDRGLRGALDTPATAHACTSKKEQQGGRAGGLLVNSKLHGPPHYPSPGHFARVEIRGTAGCATVGSPPRPEQKTLSIEPSR